VEIVNGFMPAPGIVKRNPLGAAYEGIVQPFGIEGRV
jgi:hypothetical protein